MLFRSLLLITLLISTLLLTTGCGKDDGGKDKVFKWKLQSSYGPGDQTWDIQMPMIVDAIEKETNGRIKIKTYTPGSICEPEQAPASVENGMLDCALSTAGDTGQTIPAAYAEQGIPFFWEDQEDMYETYYKYGLLEFLRKHYKEHNIYYGMPVPNGVYSLMTNFPVKKASDLKGRKIRSYSSWGQFVKNLGGSPVNIPGGDIYMAMKLGTVDGCLFTFAELYNAKLSEVTDYVMEQPASGSGFVSFIISKKAWDELPKDLQKAVNKALKDCYSSKDRKSVV